MPPTATSGKETALQGHIIAGSVAETLVEASTPGRDEKLQAVSESTSTALMTITTFLRHCWTEIEEKLVA